MENPLWKGCFNRNITNKWALFHCHVWLLECPFFFLGGGKQATTISLNCCERFLRASHLESPPVVAIGGLFSSIVHGFNKSMLGHLKSHYSNVIEIGLPSFPANHKFISMYVHYRTYVYMYIDVNICEYLLHTHVYIYIYRFTSI